MNDVIVIHNEMKSLAAGGGALTGLLLTDKQVIRKLCQMAPGRHHEASHWQATKELDNLVRILHGNGDAREIGGNTTSRGSPRHERLQPRRGACTHRASPRSKEETQPPCCRCSWRRWRVLVATLVRLARTRRHRRDRRSLA